ncbi:MAG: hypothetical protein EZS28_035212, partial [Streblomastix strix]
MGKDDPNVRLRILGVLQKYWTGTLDLSLGESIAPNISSIEYWSLFEQSTDLETKILAKFAINILSVTSQEADVERAFSLLALIMGEQRDRLSNE